MLDGLAVRVMKRPTRENAVPHVGVGGAGGGHVVEVAEPAHQAMGVGIALTPDGPADEGALVVVDDPWGQLALPRSWKAPGAKSVR